MSHWIWLKSLYGVPLLTFSWKYTRTVYIKQFSPFRTHHFNLMRLVQLHPLALIWTITLPHKRLAAPTHTHTHTHLASGYTPTGDTGAHRIMVQVLEIVYHYIPGTIAPPSLPWNTLSRSTDVFQFPDNISPTPHIGTPRMGLACTDRKPQIWEEKVDCPRGCPMM